MRITKTQVAKYLSLRGEAKEVEVQMGELKEKFLGALKENGEAPIQTTVGKVQLVKREVMRLDEDALKAHFGLQSLDAWKKVSVVESVMVTGS